MALAPDAALDHTWARSISSTKAEQSEGGRLARVCVILVAGGHQNWVMEMPFAQVTTVAMQGCQERDIFLHCILEIKLQRGYFASADMQTRGMVRTMTSCMPSCV